MRSQAPTGPHDEGLAIHRFCGGDGDVVAVYENVFYNNRNWSGLFFDDRRLGAYETGIQPRGGVVD
jgi:hypothetical protein